MPTTRARSAPKPDPVTATQEAEWLWLWARGVPVPEIARDAETTQARVLRGVETAMKREREAAPDVARPPFDLVVTWGNAGKGRPTCEEIHPRGFPAGSKLCCWECGKSGMDSHPSLQL